MGTNYQYYVNIACTYTVYIILCIWYVPKEGTHIMTVMPIMTNMIWAEQLVYVYKLPMIQSYSFFFSSDVVPACVSHAKIF